MALNASAWTWHISSALMCRWPSHVTWWPYHWRVGQDAPCIEVAASPMATSRDAPPSFRKERELRIGIEPATGLGCCSSSTSSRQHSPPCLESQTSWREWRIYLQRLKGQLESLTQAPSAGLDEPWGQVLVNQTPGREAGCLLLILV